MPCISISRPATTFLPKTQCQASPASTHSGSKGGVSFNLCYLLHEVWNDATFVNSIITEDESWCFQYDPQTKRQSAEWRSTGTPPSKKVRRQPSTTKMMIIVFSTPGVLFITNLAHKGKRSTKKFTSPYSGTCTRHFDIVVLPCGHLDSGLCCMTMRHHTQLWVSRDFSLNTTLLCFHIPRTPLISMWFFSVSMTEKKAKSTATWEYWGYSSGCDDGAHRHSERGIHQLLSGLQKRWQQCIDCGGNYFERDRKH